MIRKTASFLLCSFAALLIVFIASFAAVRVLLSWDSFFEAAFLAEDAAVSTGIALEELMEVHRVTAAFVRGEDVSPDIVCERFDGPIEFYKEDEKSHLGDVRDVFSALGGSFRISCVLAACTFAGSWILLKGRISRYLKLTALLGIIYTVFGSVMFDPLFTVLHRVLFPGGNWVFYPDISLMVNLYSEGVFIRCGALIASFILIADGLLWLTAAIIEKRGKKNWKKT